MNNKEELVKLLKKTKKMSNKYLAKRISELSEGDIVEKNRINAKCYDLLLNLMDKKSKTYLVTVDAVIKILIERICRDSNWGHEYNYFYLHEDGKISFVMQKNEGFVPGSNGGESLLKEIEFIEEYKSVLDMIDNNTKEKEEYLKGRFEVSNPEYYDLAVSLIEYLDLKKLENDNKKNK